MSGLEGEAESVMVGSKGLSASPAQLPAEVIPASEGDLSPHAFCRRRKGIKWCEWLSKKLKDVIKVLLLLSQWKRPEKKEIITGARGCALYNQMASKATVWKDRGPNYV